MILERHGLDTINWEQLKPKAVILVTFENPSHEYPGKCLMTLQTIVLDRSSPHYRMNLAVSISYLIVIYIYL